MLTWVCGPISGHKVSHTYAELLLNNFVPECQLLFEVINIVVPLLNVKLGPVFLPLEVDLLQVQQMLIVLHIDLLDLLLKHLRLIVLNQFVTLLF
jgi:hypothetical protein